MSRNELTDAGVIILSALIEPIHGYEIMKKVETYFKGTIHLGPAIVYTTLAKLLKARLCRYEERLNKKIYSITLEGIEQLSSALKKRQTILEYGQTQLNKEILSNERD